MTPPHGSGRPRAGAAAPPLAATALVGLRKAATVVHVFTDTHVEVRRAGRLRTRPGGVDVSALRAAVAACSPQDLAPVFDALGLEVGPITLRLVGGPSTTVTRAGLLVRDGTSSFATALAPGALMDVLDQLDPGLVVYVDDLTDVSVVGGSDPDLVAHAALACAIAEVDAAFQP